MASLNSADWLTSVVSECTSPDDSPTIAENPSNDHQSKTWFQPSPSTGVPTTLFIGAV